MKETEKFVRGLVCGEDWSVCYDVKVGRYPWLSDDFTPCPHFYGEHYEEHGPRLDGSMYQVRTWHCPRVLSITPDDPQHCAMVCLDCLLEKFAELGVSEMDESHRSIYVDDCVKGIIHLMESD